MHMHLNREIWGDSYLIERDGTVIDAAGILTNDILWGGLVTELSTIRMITVTTACGGFDRHTFTGTEQEMRLLREVLFCNIMVRQPVRTVHQPVLEKVREMLGGEPAYYAAHKAALEGQLGLEWAHYLPFGVRTEAELRLAMRLYECNRANLQAMLDLKNEFGISLQAVHNALFC